MNNLPLFFSDLDHTLIFSHRALQRYKDATVGTVVVEDFQNEPLSYMDMEVWNWLASESGVDFQFIPCTTRTVEQYRRVLFPAPPEYAIAQNGARLLIRGQEDIAWSQRISNEVEKLNITPDQIHARLMEKFPKNMHKQLGLKNIVNVENCFVYIVNVTEASWAVDEFVAELAAESGHVLSKQGRKIYLAPPCVSKEVAVQEVLNRFGNPQSFAAGDSVLDFPMAGVVDHFIHPRHGETWNRTDMEPSYVTQEIGLESSKELLCKVRSIIS